MLKQVKIVREDKNGETAQVPTYATAGSAGADVRAFCPGVRIVVKPDQVAMVPTGLRLSIPEFTGLYILPRSGMGKKKFTIPNAPGLLDSDYTDQLMVLIHNETDEDLVINNGDRIAQLVLIDTYQMQFVEVDRLEETERKGGFGSTGVA